MVFTIPWEKSVMVTGVGTLTRLVGLLAFVAGVASALHRRFWRPPNLPLAIAAAFVLWSAATLAWSYSPVDTQSRVFTLAQLLALAWLVWQLVTAPARQTLLLAAYVAGAAVASVLTLSRFARGIQTYYRRYAATGFEPNDLGLTVALSIPLALYLARRERGKWRWACYVAVGLALAAVMLSASRSALAASFAALGFSFLTWRGADTTHRVCSIALLVLLCLGPTVLAPSAARERLATLPQEMMQGTLHNRTQIWKAGIRAFQQRPLIGVGAGAYPEAVRPELGAPALEGHRYVAHNSYLSVLVECGLTGFLFATAAVLVLGVFVWMMPFTERALWAVMLLVCGLGMTTLTWEHRKPVWLIAALIMTGWAQAFRPEGERT
jgi:O-antigen ligase